MTETLNHSVKKTALHKKFNHLFLNVSLAEGK